MHVVGCHSYLTTGCGADGQRTCSWWWSVARIGWRWVQRGECVLMQGVQACFRDNIMTRVVWLCNRPSRNISLQSRKEHLETLLISLFAPAAPPSFSDLM